MDRLARRVLELVGGVRRDIDGGPGADRLRLAAEEKLELAFQHREHLLEIVAMRRRAGAVGHEHVDEAIAPDCVNARNQNRVSTADDGDMPDAGAVGIGDCQFTVGVVGGESGSSTAKSSVRCPSFGFSWLDSARRDTWR